MKRTTAFVLLAFVGGVIVGFMALRVDSSYRRETQIEDRMAIHKLHEADIDATLTQDPKELAALFSDNAVNLVFQEPAVGIKAIREGFEKFRAEHPEFQVLDYTNDIKEMRIVDGWAIEVSDSSATYKMSATGSPVSVPRTRGMRVLKRQSDGSWKLALVGLK